MEINIPIEQLRERRLFVATPMHSGQAYGTYTKSMIDLATLCTQYGIHMQPYFLFGESLIARGRNYCVQEFLDSDCTNMLFIDADIGFNARDVIAMLALQDPNDEDNHYDVIAGTYPLKTISWEKIKAAVDKGLADEDPNNLAKYVGSYVFNPAPGNTSFVLSEPAEVLETGTGFMMIRRRTFDKFAEAYPQQRYRPDHIRTDKFDGSKEIVAYFDTPICPDTKRYLSEDYAFCQWVRKIGMKVWICPWIQLTHSGNAVYGGSLADIAALGVSATTDPALLKKKK